MTSCSVNPTRGDDKEGAPITNGNPGFSYKTLQGCIVSLRLSGNTNTLFIDCSGGTVYLNNDTDYKDIVISSTDKSSNLICYTGNARAMLFTNVTLRISTDIEIHPRNSPAIITDGIFEMEGEALNINEVITDDNKAFLYSEPTVIFEHRGISLVDNVGGRVNAPGRDITIHSGGRLTRLSLFDNMIMTPKSSFYVANDKTIGSEIDGSQILNTNIVFTDPPVNSRIAPNSVIWASVFYKHLRLSNTILNTVTISTASVKTLIDTKSSFTFASRIDTPAKNTTQELTQLKILYKNNSKVMKLISNLQNLEETLTVSGGSLINNNPDSLDVIMSNIPGNFNQINLIDAKLFTDDNTKVLGNLSNYNITNDTNSYNNSGSIFRKVKLIDSDYTHTEFDGYNFMVDASSKDIIIMVPTDTLESRSFQYKRIDSTNNVVRIFTPRGVNNCSHYSIRNNCGDLGRIKVVGYNGKLWTV